MSDLTTKYLGLELKNPIIVGACNLVTDTENLKKLEEAGAAAIVYKSLFEEQIHLETLEMESVLETMEDRHAEMTRIFPDIQHAGPHTYLENLKKAKASVNIPLIASLNCVYEDTWVEYAKKIEETGVDALELNFYTMPKYFELEGHSVERDQADIVHQIVRNSKIPVSVKLSPYYANVLNVADRLDREGAKGVVLFNNLFQPEINIDTESMGFSWNLSKQGDHRLPLRFAGLLHGKIEADICASTGILSANEVIQVILAGATTVQVVSTLYKNGIGYLKTILQELEAWMDSKNYSNISEFRGKLSRSKVKDVFAYERAQYVDILFNSKNIFEKFPLR